MSIEYIKIENKHVRKLDQHVTNSNYITHKQQVFIIGSKGIPAAYGGFETFVEKLTEYAVSDRIRYHVSRIADDNVRFEYNKSKCFDVKVPDIGSAKAIYYDYVALRRCIDYCKARPDIKRPIFYVLACRIGIFIKSFKKEIEALGGKLYVNPDGHEWKRLKWPLPVRLYWKASEKLMVKNSDLLICDSVNIEKYIQSEYNCYSPKTTYIAYGSDTKVGMLAKNDDVYQKWLKTHGLRCKNYYLVVGRFVPENNFEFMISEYMMSTTSKDFVIITTENERLFYKLNKKLHFKDDSRIKFVGTVYDQQLLKQIREGAYGYIHGHSVGGTNPSLLEALGNTDLNLLLNVGFNREVALDSALYWKKEDGNLTKLIDKCEAIPVNKVIELGKKAKKRIDEAYSWEYIVDKYEALFLEGIQQN